MQDNAPGHHARATLREIAARGIEVIDWPPYSPDLNPIETCWDHMKNFIDQHFAAEPKPSYPTLRAWVLEGWQSIEPEFWQKQMVVCHCVCR